MLFERFEDTSLSRPFSRAGLTREPSMRLLDVRSDDEWQGEHVCGAVHLVGGYRPDRARELGGAKG